MVGRRDAAKSTILTFMVLASLTGLAPATEAQLETVTYVLEDVWLDPDLSGSWDPPMQLTGTFVWTCSVGDFENGSG
ncbi:MAG: hypothetical protein JRG76_10465 [Deltaproteobacteria bacterium]|nr:hypothetical protein [Deltaproteobacteria bacterium]MBW2414920.1 hypothetical protein [Deltaproteobacteria bacterium]